MSLNDVRLLGVVGALVLTGCGVPEVQNIKHLILRDDTSSPSDGRSMDAEAEGAYGVHARRGWKSTPVILHFEANVDVALERGVRAAARTWNDVVGFDLLTFGDVVEPYAGQDLYGRLGDGVNTIAVPPWCGLAKSEIVLGTTIWDNDQEDLAVITTSDVVFNAQFYTFVDAQGMAPSASRNVVDAESLALHELGHLIGLAHSRGRDDIMLPSLDAGPGQVRRAPSADDAARARYIYVANSPSPPHVDEAPRPTTPVEPVDPGDPDEPAPGAGDGHETPSCPRP